MRVTFAAAAVLIAIVMIGAISGYTANPTRRGPVSLGIGVLILVAIVVMGGASLGIASLLASSVAERGSVGEVSLMAGLSLLILWADSIAIQFVQNFFYRRVGAAVQPIRLWNRQSKRRRKTSSTKRR